MLQCLRFTANWIWPASRCGGEAHYWRSVRRVSPAPSALAAPSPAPSPAPSSSDDGGFLPRVRAPLRPAAAPPLFRASSPALALHWPPWPPWPPWAAAWTPWSPLHVSDLSSVPFPSSADGSFPTPPSPFRLRALRLEPARAGAPRPRARPLSRHARPRTALDPPPPHEASPESRSSSSGFGSKNASSQHNRSSRTGSLAEWRPPPYRPPPPAPPPRPGSGEAVDAGSVDVHYEWDRATRTPTPSTPERPRARPSRDDVEARVRAMKEEFLEFRKRQALRRRSPEPLSPLAAFAPPPPPAETVC
ncbi:uncharacterized protein LOC135072795 [Ostrinia nubilalis]|uniref:uncharacterized protein LOC135072795 n=1 Tax=Ostrinia nubilalis TaxID=29057 RepID=UPI0030825C04